MFCDLADSNFRSSKETGSHHLSIITTNLHQCATSVSLAVDRTTVTECALIARPSNKRFQDSILRIMDSSSGHPRVQTLNFEEGSVDSEGVVLLGWLWRPQVFLLLRCGHRDSRLESWRLHQVGACLPLDCLIPSSLLIGEGVVGVREIEYHCSPHCILHWRQTARYVVPFLIGRLHACNDAVCVARITRPWFSHPQSGQSW